MYDGILGESIRKILPNCVYNAIRQTFPSHDCGYTDFRPSDNDDIFIDWFIISYSHFRFHFHLIG